MDKIMWAIKALLLYAILIPTIVLEYVLKIVWGLFFFITTPLAKCTFCKGTYRRYRDYGNHFSIKDENFPITAFVGKLWEESK